MWPAKSYMNFMFSPDHPTIFQNILTNKYEAWRRHTIQVVDQVVDQVVEIFCLELVLTLYRR
jgi:hypothetical protein